ncbi:MULTISPECIES: hypothetical protein [Streptomyces]|uniref:hypothetical protein n=1 Tax=Streptomyces TaxID=1883 RepID=UPI0004BD0BE8|nr:MULTISPECIES: hypothetical protein [Streptomyces]KJY19888.1 hypothetical protein VR43_18280 [Streptomyces sp. NRRL S-104]
MTRTTLTQRLALLGACGALAAGGALLPSTALAAPATPQVAAAQTIQEHPAHERPDHEAGARTVVKTKITISQRTLSDGRVKVVTVKTITKITKDHHGKVVKKSVKTTTTVKIRPAPDDD